MEIELLLHNKLKGNSSFNDEFCNEICSNERIVEFVSFGAEREVIFKIFDSSSTLIWLILCNLRLFSFKDKIVLRTSKLRNAVNTSSMIQFQWDYRSLVNISNLQSFISIDCDNSSSKTWQHRIQYFLLSLSLGTVEEMNKIVIIYPIVNHNVDVWILSNCCNGSLAILSFHSFLQFFNLFFFFF